MKILLLILFISMALYIIIDLIDKYKDFKKTEEYYKEILVLDNKELSNQDVEQITSDFIDMLYDLGYNKTQYNKLTKDIKERLFKKE